jgi:hypothetical protein
MRRILSTVVLVGVGFTATPVAKPEEQDRVWVWNPQCPAPTKVALRVRLDGKTIYTTITPLCRWERKFETGKASFRFTSPRLLAWHGYRSDRDTTPAGILLAVDLWQAGGEPDVIELGYSVEASDGVHMNSLHVLSPVERSTSILAPGLILDTWPELD